MNVAKFLLVDIALLLGGSLLLLLQGAQGSPLSLGKFSTNKTADHTLTVLPDLKALLDLELSARKNGSGIEFDALNGLWKFVTVWKQGTDKEDSTSSFLLRVFSASLELRDETTREGLSAFDVTSSIRFGALSIRFIGSGQLIGPQPILSFFFERIELKLSDSVLFSRLLSIPDEKNRPFFGLIATGNSGQWLSARGRGGGLALWQKL